MAMFTWIGDATGNFEDQSNWYNDTKKKSDDGFPGAGDTAYVDADEVTVNGDTVADLRAFGTDVVGDITVTRLIESGVFSGGDVKAGTVETCTFKGVSLTANTIENGIFDTGKVTANVIVGASVDGATVTAKSIKGQNGSNVGVGVTSGSLTDDGALILVGASIPGTAGSFGVSAGTATITGEASATGKNATISSEGGTLRFGQSLTLSNGAAFDGSSGGKTTVAGTLNVGKTGAGSVFDLEGAGASLTVDGNLIVGVTGSASVVVDKEASLIVKGKMTIGDHGSVTAGSASARAGYLTIGAEGVVSLDGAGDYSGQTEIDGGELVLFSTGAAGKAEILFAEGSLELVKGATLANSIADFNTHDTIELDGVVATKDSFSNGVLTLFDEKKVVSKLNFAGSYNPLDFHVSEVGGSAIVTYSAGAESQSAFDSAGLSNALFSSPVHDPLDLAAAATAGSWR